MACGVLAESSEVELEVKRITDGSWHPCQVSLCSGGGISVKLEVQDSEDKILDIEDAFVRLRVRSVPLQGDDCNYIEEGKHVLAACEKNSQRLFFDAVVQKAIRVRHSKRASCRCTFMIKWFFNHAESEISTVPSSSVMKLAAESINSHPFVAAFLNSMENTHLSAPLSSPTALDDTEGELDLHGLLKQIEDIGSFTDASKKELLKDTSLVVDLGGSDGWTKLVASEQVSKLCVEFNCGRNHLRRSARNQNKTQTPMEDLITSATSFIEKSVENQFPLRPLAARAVLASLISKLPKKVGFVHPEEGICLSMLDCATPMHVSGGSNSHTINNIESRHATPLDNVESLMENERGASGKKLHAQKSCGTLFMEVSNKSELSVDCGSSLSSTMRDEKLTNLVGASRLTRLATKGGSENPNGDGETRLLAEDATFVRVTRSAAQKGKGNVADEVKEALLDKKVRTIGSTCSAIKRGTEASNLEYRSRFLDEGAKFTIFSNTTLLTHSAACEEAGNLGDKVKEELQAKPETESAQPYYSQKSDSVCDAMESTKKRSLPLFNAEKRVAEKEKKQKNLNAVVRRQKTAVEDLQGNVDNQSQKKSISSKSQPSRRSLRLLAH